MPANNVVNMPGASSKGGKIKREILDAVELYALKDAQAKQLEKELKALRKQIEPYMLERSLSSIESDSGTIVIEPRNMAMITSRYTSYEVDDVLKVVSDPVLLADCIVEVVDKEAIDAYIKLGKIPKEVEELKQYRETDWFVVKR
jgi:hypothetical protein